jgi:type I restriction enzyme S subunit
MEAVHEYGGLDLAQTRKVSEVGSGYTEFQDGDVIVAKITPCFENGKGSLATGLVNGVAFGTTELHVLRPHSELDRRYLFYITLSSPYRKRGEAEMYGAGGQKRVPPEFNKDFRTPLPPLQDQRCIADFLDRETMQIDALIGKKRALVENLKERRSALISSIVTRGLPPDAALAAGLDPRPLLKPSGVDWFDAVPAHWDWARIGYLAKKVGSGKTPRGGSETYQSEGVLLIRSQNVQDVGLRLSDAVFIDESVDEEMAATRVAPGDVLLNITGASLGRCAIAPADLPKANVNQHVCIIRGEPSRVVSRYLRWAISSQPVQSQIFSFESGSSREGLNFQQVRGLVVALPPTLAEQNILASYLDKEIVKMERSIVGVETAIERLLEYRTALITHAVNGKIDVRGSAA